jgi:hypothetical protein
MKLQFRVLYRQFLFRMVDLELIAVQGDISKLLGQFGGVLVFLSAMFSFGLVMSFDTRGMPPAARLGLTWTIEHFLIAITMLVVGIFAVLSWDSTFPSRRDVLVLAPLPVRPQTLFAAKIAALAAALSLTVVGLHGMIGVIFPVMITPADFSFLQLFFSLDVYRSFAAYWITMFSAGAFVFCSVFALQGLAAQLPRRYFLRLSGLLQVGALAAFVCLYFLEPALATPMALAAPENQRTLAWLPSYWFLGLLQRLNGSMHPALAPLARRAWIALAIAITGTAGAYALSYFRTLRKIVEEPDILPSPGRFMRWPRFGSSLASAILAFSARSLLRSRQHRMILAFYFGFGSAMVFLFTRALIAHPENVASRGTGPLLIASLMMMCFAVVGTRVVFSMPLELRSHWIFRITQIHRPGKYLAAIRRPLFVLGVAPVWLVSAVVFLRIWPWPQAAGHLAILGLWGMLLAYLSLYGFYKIPFTCSYMPGKTNLHMAFVATWAIFLLIDKGVAVEQPALTDPAAYAKLLTTLAVAVLLVRWQTTRESAVAEALRFEETLDPAIQTLGLSVR